MSNAWIAAPSWRLENSNNRRRWSPKWPRKRVLDSTNRYLTPELIKPLLVFLPSESEVNFGSEQALLR
jgi:hypothetical protein